MCIHFITREKGDVIIGNQLNIISRIKKLNDDYSSIINELTMIKNLLSIINTKSNSGQNPQQDISVRTDKIEGTLGKVSVSLQGEYLSTLNQDQQDIRDRIKKIQDRLEENETFLQAKFQSDAKKSDKIDTYVIENSLLKLKNAPLDMIGIITILLILTISTLTILPFFFLQDQMEVIYSKINYDTHIHLGIILIFLTLAAIWTLVFIYIKSRLKTHEQDSTSLRKLLQDN